MKEKVREVSEYIEQNAKILSVIVTILSVILTNGFKMGAYLFHKGRYEYWGIPQEYIIVDYESTLFSFLATMIIIALVLLVIYLHCIWFDLIKENNIGIVKVIKIIGIFSLVPFVIAIILIIYLATQISLNEIGIYLCTNPTDFIEHVIIISVLYFALMFGFKTMYKNEMDTEINVHDILIDKENKNKDDKNNKSKKEVGRYRLVIGFVIIIYIVGIMAAGNTLSDIGKSSMDLTSEISIAVVDDVKYAIVGQYQDYWIVKQCLYDGEGIIINSEHYMLTDISDKDIWRVTLKGGETISNFMVGADEFNQLTAVVP